MKFFIEDLKFCLRLLKKTPVFSSTCIIVITLGLAVAIANYSFTHAFRKPPPFIEGDKFSGIRVFNEKTGEAHNWDYFNAYAFKLILEQQRSFEFVDASQDSIVSVIHDGLASRRYLAEVTPDLIANTRVKPLFGRIFSQDDLQGTQGPVVVISFQLWQTQFLGDTGVIGRSLEINGRYHTVIGVMPKDFFYPIAQDIWRPLTLSSQPEVDSGERLGIVGKRLANVSYDAATADINRILTQLKNDLPQQFENINVEVVPVGSIITGNVRGLRELLLALTVVIFLLASLNLSTLLFTRANHRIKELAVRNSVGANTWQLRKQILLESGLLCVNGCLFGLTLAFFILKGVEHTFAQIIQSQGVFNSISFDLSPSSLYYAFGMTLVIWLLSSFITVYKISNSSLLQSLDGSAKGATSRTGALTTRLVVGAEVIFSSFLLILCGVLTFSIIGTYQLDYGSKDTNLYIGEFSLPQDKFQSTQEQTQFLQTLSQQVANNLPASTSVSFTNSPTGGWNWPGSSAYGLDDRDISSNGIYPTVITGVNSSNYFNDISVKITDGRGFDSSDTNESQPVVIVDANLAETLWPNESAIGKQIQLNPLNDGPWLTIIGVNNHIIHGMPMGEPDKRYAIYRPISQQRIVDRAYIVLKVESAISVSELFIETRKAFVTVDRTIALDNLVPYQDFMVDSQVVNRLFAEIAGWFSTVTLLLSVVGVYAIVARSIMLRKREIGIRQALGSTKAKITHLFLKQGLTYLLVGIIVGGGSALVASGGLANLFPNINQNLLWVSTTVIAVMSALIFMASYLPTHRTLATEPGDALREG